MRMTTRVFGWLMVLGSCGHTAGTFKGYPMMSQIFVWSLGTSLAGALLGALHILRAGRFDDKPLAAIAGVGTAMFALVAVGFGKSIGDLADPRVLGNFLIAAVLVISSLATLARGGTTSVQASSVASAGS